MSYEETGIDFSEDASAEELCVTRSGLQFLVDILTKRGHSQVKDINNQIAEFDLCLSDWCESGNFSDLLGKKYHYTLDEKEHWWWPIIKE